METVTVNASTPYAVHIGGGLLDGCGPYVRKAVRGSKCVLVSDSSVDPLYGDRVTQSLDSAGFTVCRHVFPAGERHKNLTTWGEMLERFAREKLTRSDCVAALGGGVTGDMAGFAAATYQRGIDYVQLPTTFLAASDASVGGKTAVDLAAGKNLAGAFWQPRVVLCDTDTFRTLPPSGFLDGLAETVKHGLIADRAFFRFLLSHDPRENINAVVRRNVEIKAAVVAEDEREGGKRKILNFGHTLGHAIEKCSGYRLSHGHAVAVGMILASRAAERLGLTPPGVLETLLDAYKVLDLPSQCSYDSGALYDAATGDKKRSGGRIDVVVLEEIGRARLVSLDMEGLKEFVEAAI